ncbi:hypothetical protein G6R29_02335 [Fructobacillus sp. M2-14]|uniref:Uncharacterized protein n=1 Tax=Fructobacillus broussonetiae TaxID=2713173 RepID=A0ABS5QZ90_9LACO|nr:hypothetical protein [Fructobacillus broussonetiae]MBS9338475.1 hypothetical protein [Fructobacillus broussonetiae]
MQQVREVLPVLVELAQIVNPLGIFIALVVYHKNVCDREEDKKRERVLQSILFLEKFESDWRQEIKRLNDMYLAEIRKKKQALYGDKSKERIHQHQIDEAEKEIYWHVEEKLQMKKYFNKLEYLSLYLNYRVVDIEIVLPIIEKQIMAFAETSFEMKIKENDETDYVQLKKLIATLKKKEENKHERSRKI